MPPTFFPLLVAVALSGPMGQEPEHPDNVQTAMQRKKLKRLRAQARAGSSCRTMLVHLGWLAGPFPIGLLPINGATYKSSLSNVIFTHFAKMHKIYNGK